jgi:hypothetical protein
MAEPIFIKPGMNIIAPEPISTTSFINPSHQSACLYVYPSLLGNGSVKCIPSFGAGQRLGKHFPAATNTHYNGIVGRVIFYAIRVLSKETLGLCVYPPIIAR